MRIHGVKVLWITGIIILALLGACSKNGSEGVGEVIGLKFGQTNTYKINEGPREPPAFYPGLREFYEIDFPNMEFDFVGVAVTKNSKEAEKDGIHFVKENVIWAGFFSNKTECNKELFDKTYSYIKNNWKITAENFTTSKESTSYNQSANILTSNAFWEVSCWKNLGLTLIVRDFSALINSSDEKSKVIFKKIYEDTNDTFSRKM